mmetsp:Transcript_832/g.2963  ORF Transcript_832/g.2963 Transcript_832/m.2963 type:complete len:313 (-) Transcript_832:200-1138(-)
MAQLASRRSGSCADQRTAPLHRSRACSSPAWEPTKAVTLCRWGSPLTRHASTGDASTHLPKSARHASCQPHAGRRSGGRGSGAGSMARGAERLEAGGGTASESCAARPRLHTCDPARGSPAACGRSSIAPPSSGGVASSYGAGSAVPLSPRSPVFPVAATCSRLASGVRAPAVAPPSPSPSPSPDACAALAPSPWPPPAALAPPRRLMALAALATVASRRISASGGRCHPCRRSSKLRRAARTELPPLSTKRDAAGSPSATPSKRPISADSSLTGPSSTASPLLPPPPSALAASGYGAPCVSSSRTSWGATR